MWVAIRISLKSLMFYKDTKEGQVKSTDMNGEYESLNLKQ